MAARAPRASTHHPSSFTTEYQGGDFGRRSGMEHTTEAVLLAKATGRAVKVVWTTRRGLEGRSAPGRHSWAARAPGTSALTGLPVAYEAKNCLRRDCGSDSFPGSTPRRCLWTCRRLDLVGSSYGIPNEAGNLRQTFHFPSESAPFRGNNDTHNGFMLESMIDDGGNARRE